MDVLIVVVNYRSAGLTVDCLKTLQPEVLGFAGKARVVVTDNASGDGSLEALASAIEENGWDSWVEVKPLDRNGGFAFGNNAAIRPALASSDPPRHLWMLNPDTLVRPGALRSMVEFLDARPDVGLAGSRVENRDGTTQWSKFPFPTVATEFEGMVRIGFVTRRFGRSWTPRSDHDAPIPVDWVSGASLMIRRAVFEAIGLLDEGYFMYYEEVDFTLRAAKAGWPCWYVPQASVVHLIGQTSGVSDPNAGRKRRPSYWFEARRRYFLTHHGRFKTLLADLAWTSAYAINRVKLALKREPPIEPRLMFWDFLRYNVLMIRPHG
jgi:N-acetylglucosaminyl-diphospho-decaprenol L-rhamnosyltransferase